jgi:hypothetical protein
MRRLALHSIRLRYHGTRARLTGRLSGRHHGLFRPDVDAYSVMQRCVCLSALVIAMNPSLRIVGPRDQHRINRLSQTTMYSSHRIRSKVAGTYKYYYRSSIGL